MVKENLKRKKRHDKDKYYHLAKEQGYRSRAAFKLIQINRKYDFLSRARVCIDLCAAPGGWCQVAAKHMPSGSIVLGVDLLPIRPIPKVHTLVQDITTSECRALLKKEMKGHTADVVLCDGAPNVGGAYNKDAYVQNEIALAALRVATHHLGVGGTFLTKVYRSSDYNALIWVFNQLFQTVQAIKPSSSRQQSAEIFVLCLKYRAPRTIDPKLLDPQFVFQEIEDPNSTRGLTVLHDQFDKHNKRKRGGYEAGVGVLLLKRTSVSSFIESEDPIRMLTDYNQLVFEEGCQPYLEHKLTTSEIKTCLDDLKVLGKGDFKSLLRWRLKMQAYRDSLVEALKAQEAAMAGDAEEKDSGKEPAKQTEEEEEEEIQGEISALQAAKAAKAKREKKKEREQRARLRLRQAYGMNQEGVDVSEGQETVFSLKDIKDAVALEKIRRGDYADVPEGEDDDDLVGPEGDDEDDDDVEARNAALEAELEESYHQFLSNKADERMKGTRAGKRKKAALAALASEQTAEDMALYDGDLQEYAKLLGGKKDKDDDSDSFDDDDEEEKDNEDDDAEESQGDDDADNDRGEDDEGDVSTDDNEDKGVAGKAGSRGRKGNPLVVDPSVFAAPEKAGVKVARWFSNPVFSALQAGLPEAGEKDDSCEQQARKGKKAGRRIGAEERPDAGDDSDAEMDDDGEREDGEGEGLEEGGGDAEQAINGRKAQQKQAKAKAVVKSGKSGEQKAAIHLDPEIKGLAAEVLASMPKTDKQIRHEKRMKARERKERKASKRKRGVGSDDEDDAELELVPGDGGSSMQLDDDGDDDKMLDPKEVEEQKKRREIIKAGMGKVLQQGDDGKGQGFEVVPEGYEGSSNKRAKLEELVPRADDRAYGTDDEMWDDEERAATLAIGTMMLRRSKAKELVDASYNRFAWNDPSELPEWFIDDEHKHYRPQIPIPKPLLDEMKEKFKTLTSKPIAKVAEARARKKKRAMVELKKAKARATAITANPDMTEKEKLKAIQKATKGRGSISKPGKVYAVVRGGGTSSVSKKGKKGSEGGRSRVKLVDKRMKKDARGMAKVGKGGRRKGGGKKAGKKGKR